MSQSFNMEQTAFATESLENTIVTVHPLSGYF